MLARGVLGSGWTCGVSFWPFLNSSGWWWLISSVFLIRISCHKTAHANGYYGAWPGWTVSISVLPLTNTLLTYLIQTNNILKGVYDYPQSFYITPFKGDEWIWSRNKALSYIIVMRNILLLPHWKECIHVPLWKSIRTPRLWGQSFPKVYASPPQTPKTSQSDHLIINDKTLQNFKISLSLIQNWFGYPVSPITDKTLQYFFYSCSWKCAIMIPVSLSVLFISLFSLESLAYISK